MVGIDELNMPILMFLLDFRKFFELETSEDDFRPDHIYLIENIDIMASIGSQITPSNRQAVTLNLYSVTVPHCVIDK